MTHHRKIHSRTEWMQWRANICAHIVVYVDTSCHVLLVVEMLKKVLYSIVDIVRFEIIDRLFTATNVATNTGFQCSCQDWLTVNNG